MRLRFKINLASAFFTNKKIDVKNLIDSHDISEHIDFSDKYFQDFSIEKNTQFAKPFMGMHTLSIISNLGAVLRILKYRDNLRILDFGAGTGWLSQYLALMGSDVVAVDVSKTALRLGCEYTQMKYPELTQRIQYLPFDGLSLDLPSNSIDRIICFDSFHHVPNQQQVIREFYRVLRDGGRVAFSEPGPRHSRTKWSQYEMRNHNVIENDIDMDEVWSAASASGFKDMKMAVFMTRPILCSMDEFNALRSLRTAWKLLGRIFFFRLWPMYRNIRVFVLLK